MLGHEGRIGRLIAAGILAICLAACGSSGSGNEDTGGNGTTGTGTTGTGTTGDGTTGSGTGDVLKDWNLATGAYAPDTVSTADFLELTIALDTLTATSASSRLAVGTVAGNVTPVTLDGASAITLTRDAYGLTIRSKLPSGTNASYRLTGTAATSITVYSDNAYGLVLDNATITSPDGPALNLQSKQTAFIALAGGNALSDSSTWSSRTTDDGGTQDLKATAFAEGPIVIGGSGSLRVDAATRHALASDAHIRLTGGTVTLAAAAKDGIRANDAFVMDGGTLAITTAHGAGKGIKVEGKEDDEVPLGFIAINAGTLTINSYDKAITASWESAEDGETATLADDPDPRVTINGGTITITTFGTPYEDRNTADGDDSLSPEGIEAKSVLTINGGLITVTTTDDALNAGSAIAINGGRLYAASSTNDAIDSNGTLSISGGIVVALGANGAEGALDSDENTFAVTGGIFVGLGGRNSNVTAAASSQNAVSARNLSAGTWVLRDDAGNAAFAFRIPRSASAMLLSAPTIATGSSYTVVTGGTLGAVGEDFHGLAIDPTTHSGGTAGTRFTVTGRISSL